MTELLRNGLLTAGAALLEDLHRAHHQERRVDRDPVPAAHIQGVPVYIMEDLPVPWLVMTRRQYRDLHEGLQALAPSRMLVPKPSNL